jgi:hypothetical protein
MKNLEEIFQENVKKGSIVYKFAKIYYTDFEIMK